MSAIGEGWSGVPDAISINVTNHGPSSATLRNSVAYFGKAGWFSKSGNLGFLSPYNNYPRDLNTNGPFSAELPKTLEVGGEYAAYFPMSIDWFEGKNLPKIGFVDTFGRMHWASKRDVAEVRERVLKNGVGHGDD